MKKLLRLISRFLLIIPAIVLQILWYLFLLVWLSNFSEYINIVTLVFQVIIVLDILNQRGESKYRLLWIIIVLALPIFGIWIYFLGGNRRTSKPIIRKLKKGNKNKKPIKINSDALKLNNSIETETLQTINMLQNLTNSKLVETKLAKYYSLGEEMYVDLISDLKNAKHFIFMEYFIIEKGKFWDSIVEILKEKVKENVDVRIMFDDIGSISTHSLSSWRSLKKTGIKITPFNPVTAVKFTLNNRDHRKMTIIDGQIVYSGGVNIADEYINEKQRFGHWKDIGFKLTGKPVASFFNMFSAFWNAYSKFKINENDYKKYFSLTDSLELNLILKKFIKINNNEKNANYISNFIENNKECAVFCNKKIKNADYYVENLKLAKFKNINQDINIQKQNQEKYTKKSYTLTYYDSPNKIEQVSNKYFINILGSAIKYAYFYTPYLIFGESLKEAFILAAQRGVDVRIIIPGIPDKKTVYQLTKKYAEELTMYGVKVYVYGKGFVHAKASIVDDRICSIGTVNLDYRSLYLHFENNTIFVDKNIINELKTDFLSTQEKSNLIEKDKIKKNVFKKIFRLILDIFSPLM